MIRSPCAAWFRAHAAGVVGVLLLAVPGVAPVAAQATGSIAGTIVEEETGDPVAGAEVWVVGGGLAVLTGSEGRFRIDAVAAGERIVEARALGLAPATTTIAVVADEVSTVELRLPLDPIAVQQVVVSATRQADEILDVPSAVAVRDVDELRQSGFLYGTDEFRRIPGISFRRGEGDGDEFPFVSIRGLTGTEGYLALVDNIPLVGIFEEPLLSEVPYDALERIEVVKGPASALYGRGALYGAVNYVTRAPRRNRSTVAVTVGEQDLRRATLALERRVGGSAGLLLQATLEDAGGWREHGSREIASLFAKGTFPLGTQGSGSLYAVWSQRSAELPNGLPLGEDGDVLFPPGSPQAFVGFGNPSNEHEVAMTALKLERALAPGVRLEFAGHARRSDADSRRNLYDPFGFDSSRSVYGINGIRSLLLHEVLFGESTLRVARGRHEMLIGLMGEKAWINADNDWTGQNGFTPECGFTFFLIEIDYRTGRILNDGHPCFETDAPLTRSRFWNDTWGLFVQDQIRLSSRLRATVGLRYDAYSRDAAFEPLPGLNDGGTTGAQADALSSKLALSWRSEAGQVYASYGRGFASNFGPTFEWNPAEYAREPNRPTTVDNYELGWKGVLADGRVRFDVAGFHTTQRNRRTTIPNPAAEEDFSAPFNLVTYGQVYRVRGAEFSLAARVTATTSVEAAYSRVDAKWEELLLTGFGGDQIDLSGEVPRGVAPNTFHASLSQRIGRSTTVKSSFEWYDDYQLTQDNSFTNGAYGLLSLDASFELDWREGLLLNIGATNVLDTEYYFYFGGRERLTYATPGPPRQIRAGLRAAF